MLRPHLRILLLATLAALPCTARADPISFTYSWSIAGGRVDSYGPGPFSGSQTTAPDGSSVTVNYGNGSTTLTVAGAGTASASILGSYFSSVAIPLATLTTPASTGPVGGDVYFLARNLFTLHLTDAASGQSGILNLYGNTYGNVSHGIVELGVEAGTEHQYVLLGGHLYWADGVSPLTDTSPGSDPVAYFTQVYVADQSSIASQSNNGFGLDPVAPEPSSLLLAGSALSLMGGAALRRRHERGRVGRIVRT